MTSCWDCYVAAQVAYISGGKCAKHSTAEERAEFERRITELVNSDHPLIKFVNERFDSVVGSTRKP